MPGPRNQRKRSKRQTKKHQQQFRKLSGVPLPIGTDINTHGSPSSCESHNFNPRTPSPRPYGVDAHRSPYDKLEYPLVETPGQHVQEEEDERSFEGLILPPPYIHDPGNGPRVRDTRVFLGSYFAQPPALDDPLCAEFAQDEVLQMLRTVLPEETALILWYNKSRSTGRICPACQRLYRLGDVLPGLMGDEDDLESTRRSPQLEREQEISGLCSPVCFILAAWTHGPGTSIVKAAWGRMVHELTDEAWTLLTVSDAPASIGVGAAKAETAHALAMLLWMTRQDDLGLGQLCLPDVEFFPEEERASLDC